MFFEKGRLEVIRQGMILISLLLSVQQYLSFFFFYGEVNWHISVKHQIQYCWLGVGMLARSLTDLVCWQRTISAHAEEAALASSSLV